MFIPADSFWMWVTRGMSAIQRFMRAWAKIRAGPFAASAALAGTCSDFSSSSSSSSCCCCGFYYRYIMLLCRVA